MYNKFALFLSAIGKIKINMQGKTAVLKDNLMTTWSFYWYKYNITKTVTFYGFEKTDKLHATFTPYYYFIDQVSNHNIHPSYYFHCYLHITTHTCTLDYVTVHRVYTKTSKHSVHLLWKSSAPEISNWKWNWKRNLAFFQVVWKKR